MFEYDDDGEIIDRRIRHDGKSDSLVQPERRGADSNLQTMFDYDDDGEIIDRRIRHDCEGDSDAERKPPIADSSKESVEVGDEAGKSDSLVQPEKSGADSNTAIAENRSAAIIRDAAFLCLDAGGILRGSCSACSICSNWCSNMTDITWDARRQGLSVLRNADKPCERCGCAFDKHRDLSGWLDSVRICVRRFRKTGVDTRRTPPSYLRLPIEAVMWEPVDVALYVLTLGKYNYTIHGVPPAPVTNDHAIVSVCVPTSTKRHDFHPLLYENFRRQKYEPKELVVVDIGVWPSSFLQLKSKLDSRVIYRHFHAHDATEDRREAGRTILCGRGSNIRVPVQPRLENWSLGLKRNVCCRLARGAILAHFDDDDLYSPDYLGFMCNQLLSGVALKKGEENASSARRGEYPSIATLSQWHLMDMPDKIFRWMDPLTESMPKEWRDPMIYGYGFSYIYTRAAWLLHAFPDVETSEDDKFMENLRKSHVLVTLAQLPTELCGLVAHVSHSENTGLMEWKGQSRQGKIVDMPEAFGELMPLVDTLIAKHPSRRAARPPPASVPLQTINYPGIFKGKGKGGKGKGGKGFGKRRP